MVIALRNCLTDKILPVYFNEGVNLLTEYKTCQLDRIVGYLKRVANRGIISSISAMYITEASAQVRIIL